MKTRKGLVSNSSSSSFIVLYRDSLLKKKSNYLLSKQTVQLLKKNGFVLSTCTHPSNLTNSDFLTDVAAKNAKRKNYVSLSYARDITCNQNDIIYFLVKNNIPFIASIHYGHQNCIYQKNSKYVYFFNNFGSEVETYHKDDDLDKVIEDWNKMGYNRPYRKILVTSFMKQEELIAKEIEAMDKVNDDIKDFQKQIKQDVRKMTKNQ